MSLGKKTFAIFLSVVAVAACATTENFEKHLQNFVGHSEDELIHTYGVPDSSFPLANGDHAVAWNRSFGATTQVNRLPHSHTATETTTVDSCKITFFVGADHIVKSWLHNGNSCQSTN